MKNTIQLFGLLGLLFACAGGDGDDEPVADGLMLVTVDDGPPEEIGTLQQAYSRPGGYGSEGTLAGGGGTEQCYAPWTGSECWTPRSKTLKYNQQCSSGDSDVTNGFLSSISSWTTAATAAGWTVIYDATSSRPTNGLKVEVRCDMPAGSSGPGIIGAAVLQMLTSNSINQPDGTIKRFHYAAVGIDIAQIQAKIASGYYGSCGSTCKRNIYHNAYMHELGHSIGYGHEQPGVQVSANVMVSDWPWSQAQVPFTTFQTNRLNSYSP